MQFIDVLPKQSNGVIADGPTQIDHWDVIVYGVDTFVNLTRPLADYIIDQYPGAIVREVWENA